MSDGVCFIPQLLRRDCGLKYGCVFFLFFFLSLSCDMHVRTYMSRHINVLRHIKHFMPYTRVSWRFTCVQATNLVNLETLFARFQFIKVPPRK